MRQLFIYLFFLQKSGCGPSFKTEGLFHFILALNPKSKQPCHATSQQVSRRPLIKKSGFRSQASECNICGRKSDTLISFLCYVDLHHGIIPVNNQLDAQFFLICLFQFSTCFEQPNAHHQENQLYQYNIWCMPLVVGGPLYAGRAATARYCIDTIDSPDDEHGVTPRKCSWYSFLLEAESTPGP
jgi:hypothetical protein